MTMMTPRNRMSAQFKKVLASARVEWADGRREAAIKRATGVFLADGRDGFGPEDQPLFDAMLQQLRPPSGFSCWEDWFASEGSSETKDNTSSTTSVYRKVACTRLHIAAEAGDISRIDELIASGADVNAVFPDRELRWTPLCEAVFSDHLDVVRRLLENGARVGGGEITSAILSVKSVPVAELLCENGARCDDSDSLGRTVLARVVDALGSVELARFVAERSSPPTSAQVAVLESVAKDSSNQLRAVVQEFLRVTKNEHD